MKAVEEYYIKLHKLFIIYLPATTLQNEKKSFRPEYLNIYYFKLEDKVRSLLHKNSDICCDEIPKFKLQIKKFFQREYFHNTHFFFSLIYKEYLIVNL